jgi:tRNA pseudouridine13 synthase
MGAEEASVGIECNANSAEGFRAILKERYTDFVVNEIDQDGEVVHLTTLDASIDDEIDEMEQQKRQKFASPAVERAEGDKPEQKNVSSEPTPTPHDTTAPEIVSAETNALLNEKIEAAVIEFTKLAGAEEAARLKTFLEQPGVLSPAPEGSEAPSALVLGSSNDKAYRTSLHVFFNSHFQLTTDSVEPAAGGEGSVVTKKDSKKPHLCIRVHPKHAKRNKGGGDKKRGRGDGGNDNWKGHKRWPVDLPQYLEFTLCKENKETQDAMGVISRILHTKPRDFGFAGTKDRRGVTSQRMTLHKVRASRLAKLKLFQMKVGNFKYVDRELGLGDLKGNLFTLTLRGVEGGTEDTVTRAVNELKLSGVINYFGLQRFGTHAIGTHEIGAALLRGAWAEVHDLILRPRDGDNEDAAAARAIYKETGDAAAALKRMPRYCNAERGLLEALGRCGKNDLVNPLSGIPRTTRKMYVHAYQSYMWNKAASERVRRHGLSRPVAGDLIVDESMLQYAGEDDGDIFSRVREVTAKEAASGAFKITDVVLPLPGNRVIYSESLKSLYEEICKKDGVQLTGFAHTVKEYSFGFLPGAYRKLVIKPDKIEYSFARYSDPKTDLTATDLMRVEAGDDSVQASGEDKDGKFLALRLSFALPTSSYATMVIRELMKSTSSQAAHRAMTLADKGEEVAE